MNETIAAGEFKARCLKIMDQVNQQHTEITITKHGKPIAKMVPITPKKFTAFGCMKGTIQINGDIISPIDVEWDAEK